MKPFFRILIVSIFLAIVALSAQSTLEIASLPKGAAQDTAQNHASLNSTESPRSFFFLEEKEESGVNEKHREYTLDLNFLPTQPASVKTVFIVRCDFKQNFKKAFVPIYIRGQALLC